MSGPLVLVDPPRHPYVDRLHGTVAQLLHRDVDTLTRHDPDWIAEHARTWDIVHLHLGLSEATPDRLIAAVAAHRRRGVPIVVTVHDVRMADATGEYIAVADVLRELDRHVAAVVALTPRCADALQEGLDRPVRVIPHGPVIPRPARERLRSLRRMHQGAGPLLLVLHGLPRHIGWLETIEASSRTFNGRPLRILVDAAQAATVTRAAEGYPHVTVATSGDAEALHRAVATAAAVIEPWRWGGHSWLVELAADIGTPVIATDVGFLADQHPVLAVRCPDGQIDIDDLAAAMDADLSVGVSEADRDADALAFIRGHERLYRRLLLGQTSARSLTGTATG